MSTRVDPRRPVPVDTHPDEAQPKPAANARRAPSPTRTEAPPTWHAKDRLVESVGKSRYSLSPIVGWVAAPKPGTTKPDTRERAPVVSDEAKIRAALEDSTGRSFGVGHRPAPARGDAQAIREELARHAAGCFAPPRPPSPPRAPSRLVRASADGPGPETRFRADTLYGSLERRHETTRAALEASIRHWQQAADSTSSPSDGARARENLASARATLCELDVEFGAATREYEVLLGLSQASAAKQGTPIDPHAPPARSPLERLEDRLSRYDHSVETLKSSGVLVQPIAVAYGLAAALHGRTLDSTDYQNLDNIYALGESLDAPYKLRAQRPGAESIVPGVDYRPFTPAADGER